MFKIIGQVLFFIMISCPLWGQSSMYNIYFTQDNLNKALSVVEIVGTLKGTGVLALMNERPVVITNSHNVGGKKSVIFRLPSRSFFYNDASLGYVEKNILEIKTSAKVLYDFPLSDFAVIEIPENIPPSDRQIIEMYARTNGVLNKSGWHPTQNFRKSKESIAAILNGEAISIPTILPYIAEQIPDNIISGDGLPIWLIHIYARPGVSGGAFYRNGLLEGLVTKISLSGEPIALATPFEKIARVLFNNQNSELEQKVHWNNGELLFDDPLKKIIVKPSTNGGSGGETGNGGSGGETGNGGSGGETGNGGKGGETGNGGDSSSIYWHLEVSDPNGEHEISTWNPFKNRSNRFNFNGQDIALFQNNKTLSLPTLPLFLFNEKKGITQKLIVPSEALKDNLAKNRINKKIELSFGRSYQYNPKKNLYSIYRGDISELADGAQPLKPDRNGKWQVPKASSFAPAYPFDSEAIKDKEGYYIKFPFFTKISDENFLDIKIHDQYLLGKKDQPGMSTVTYFTAPKNLEEIRIKCIETTQSGKQIKEKILRPVNFNSLGSLIFKTDDDEYKAAYIYSSEDVTKLERIYIESNGFLMEFWVQE